jgi:hypothetical protein
MFPDDLRIWDAIPRLITGKLDSRQIRERYVAQCPWEIVDHGLQRVEPGRS